MKAFIFTCLALVGLIGVGYEIVIHTQGIIPLAFAAIGFSVMTHFALAKLLMKATKIGSKTPVANIENQHRTPDLSKQDFSTWTLGNYADRRDPLEIE